MTYRGVHLSQVKPSGFATHLIEHLVEKYQPRVRSLLDVGCGAGGYTREWQKKFPNARIVALDLDPAPIAGVKTLKYDLSMASMFGQYDVVFSKSVLEHLQGPATQGFVRILKENIAPGGIGFVMLPDWKTCVDVFFDDYTHVSPYTEDSLRDMLRVNGLNAEVSVFWQVPFAWKHPKLWKVVRRFWWAVRDKDLQYRMKHAALLAVVRA